MRSIGMTNFEFLILIEFLNGLIFKLSHWNLIRNWKLEIPLLRSGYAVPIEE